MPRPSPSYGPRTSSAGIRRDGACCARALRRRRPAATQPLAAPWLRQHLAVLEQDVAAADGKARPAADLPPVVGRVAGPGPHGASVDRAPQLRVEDEQVGVAPDCDRAFARIEPEQAGR